MITLFHIIFVIFVEFSLPVWQNEVRQITQQVVEAMREAEREKKRIKSSRSPRLYFKQSSAVSRN